MSLNSLQLKGVVASNTESAQILSLEEQKSNSISSKSFPFVCHSFLAHSYLLPLKACCAHHANHISNGSKYHSPVQ